MRRKEIPLSSLRSIYIDLRNRMDTLMRYCYNRNALYLKKKYPDLPLSDSDVIYIYTLWAPEAGDTIELYLKFTDGHGNNHEKILEIPSHIFFREVVNERLVC